MIQVRAPDGSIAQFPDGTPDATIRSIMARHYGAPSPQMRRAQADAKASLEPAAAEQIMHGMLLGFDPEIGAAATALGVGTQNLLGHGPGYGMKEAYDATAQAIRDQNAQYAAQHPGASFGLNILGGLGTPGASLAGRFVGGAKSLPGAMARAGAVGAAYGGVAGAGNAGPGHRVSGAEQGAAVGAITGGAIPPTLSALRVIASKSNSARANIAARLNRLGSAADPEAAPTAAETDLARRNVAQIMNTAKVTPEALAAHPAVVAGKPVTTAEAIGRTGVTQLGALARRSGTVGDDLGPLIADRQLQMPARIQQDFATAAGIDPAAARGDIDALVAKLRQEASPLYTAALSDPGPVMNADLAALAQRPVIKKAIAQVGQDMLNAGQNPTAAGLQIDPETGLHVLGIDNATPELEQQPTAQTWDAIKQAIGRQIERHPITGRPLPDSQSSGNYGVRIASQDLTRALAGDPANGIEGAIPGYRAALDKAGDYLSMLDAYDKGGKLLMSPNVSEKDFADVYNGLDDASQQAFKGGFANKLFDMAQNGQLKPGAFKAPRVQQKLSMVLGPDQAGDFLNNVHIEGGMASTGQRMAPGNNSPTMEFSNAAAEQEGGPNVLHILHALHNPLGAIQGLVDASAKAGTSPQVRSEMGRILMQDPNATVDELKLIPAPASAQPSFNLGPVIPALSSATGADLLG